MDSVYSFICKLYYGLELTDSGTFYTSGLSYDLLHELFAEYEVIYGIYALKRNRILKFGDIKYTDDTKLVYTITLLDGDCDIDIKTLKTIIQKIYDDYRTF